MMMIREIVNNKVFSADGTRIAYQKTGSGPALLLIHGSGSDHNRWAAVTPLLAPYFTVYSMDRRGRGDSDDSTSYSIAREYEDIFAMAAMIAEPFDIVAHSFGAACALGAAAQIPNLNHLILYEPPLLAWQQSDLRWQQIERMEQALARGDRETVVLILLHDMLNIPLPAIERLRTTPAWDAQIETAGTIPRELRCSAVYGDDPAYLRSIQNETIFLLGSESLPGFHTTTSTLLNLLPNSRLSVLEGQQHSAMLTAPALFSQEVSRYLLFCELGC